MRAAETATPFSSVTVTVHSGADWAKHLHARTSANRVRRMSQDLFYVVNESILRCLNTSAGLSSGSSKFSVGSALDCSRNISVQHWTDESVARTTAPPDCAVQIPQERVADCAI